VYRPILCLPLVMLAGACSEGSSTKQQSPPEEPAVAGLERLSSCADIDTLLREKSRTEMNKSLDDAIEALNEGNTNNCIMYEGVPAAASVATNSTGAGPTSVSETNNQVAGVDEADLVKTDGKFIYLAQGTELRIVSAWPADAMSIASRIPLDGNAKKLFVLENRALVYVSMPRTTTNNNEMEWMSGQSGDCTYGYSCDFSGDGTATRILVFDISDRAQPEVLRTIDMPGSLVAARRIGSAVHTVVSIGDLTVPGLEPYYATHCGGRLTGDALLSELDRIEQIRAKNNAKIDVATFNVGVLAREGDSVIGKADCSDFYREQVADGAGLTTVMSLDLKTDATPTLSNVLSRAGAVYASESSLYMAVPHRKTTAYGWFDSVAIDEASTVHRFRIGIDPTKTDYLASGVVPGHVLNQFAMDEYDGVLRIATSKGAVPDPQVESALTILRQSGINLDTIGQIDGIAPGEDIRSVRFQGERGYVVTFKKTDPLFVLDLSNPATPTLTGELKIPGFSTYLHPLDATHLLALGYEADDQGSFAYFNGIQLQIFDVTNPILPTLLQKKVYGTRGSSSSALTDHLGFTFLPDRHLLTLPMSICDGGGNGRYGTLSFSGVVALDVSIDNGFTEFGRLEEPYPASQAASGFVYGGACSDWWTESNSVVTRTVVMDDFLYAISDNRVRVQNLGALGTDVKIVDFQ
jgi:uncharacterized secreted protein with C-terminal beta-propeller domain